ncbi:mesoderm development candidate 1, partial [Biomphalaria pfeifferi]
MRIQTVSELLLISCTPRPVFTRQDDLELCEDNFIKYRDKVISQLNKMMILSRDLTSQAHGKQIHWKQFCHQVQELTTVVVYLSELCAHIAYLIAINIRGSEPALAGPVTNIHQMTQADLDIKFTCTRLKRLKLDDIPPHVLVDLCSSITKSLTAVTDICKNAAEKISDPNDQDQFKLCIKAITSTTGCLVSSIKCFKQSPTETHLRRVVAFCDPVTSASSALLCFASEESFMGAPGILSSEASEIFKSILGLSMSIASANIQICRAVRDLVYAPSPKRNQDRLSLCVESVTRSSSQLRDLLLTHEFISKSIHNTDIEPNKLLPLVQQCFIMSADGKQDYRYSKASAKQRNHASMTLKEKAFTSPETETNKEIISIGTVHVIDPNGFDKSPTNLTSPPSSLSMEVTFEDIHLDNQQRVSSPNHISPLLSMSTSTLSLASTSSFNIDSLCFIDKHSAINEVKEPIDLLREGIINEEN